MSESERTICAKLAKAVNALGEKQRERLLGYAEGVADAMESIRQNGEKKEEE